MSTKKDSNALLVKVCGTTNSENAEQIAKLHPDMMGFVLYPHSKRYIGFLKAREIVSSLPKEIAMVAVLVNEPLASAMQIAESGVFNFIQLHGNESPDYCQMLAAEIPVIKAFGISTQLPSGLESYSSSCTYFLFDTKSKEFGGSGHKFDHKILNKYGLSNKFILSGGIDIDVTDEISMLHLPMLAGIDINSKFEIAAGVKDVDKVSKLINKMELCTRK